MQSWGGGNLRNSLSGSHTTWTTHRKCAGRQDESRNSIAGESGEANIAQRATVVSYLYE